MSFHHLRFHQPLVEDGARRLAHSGIEPYIAICHTRLAFIHLRRNTMDVTVDKFGRIVIPKSVRDWLGLKAGTELHLEVTEQATGERTIALRPAEEKPLLVEEDGLLIYSGALLVENFDVVEHLRASRQNQTQHLAGLKDRTG